MRKCDKKRLKRLKANLKLTKAGNKFKEAFANSNQDLSANERILAALDTLSTGNLKLWVNNPDEFDYSEIAATLLTERLFQLKQ